MSGQVEVGKQKKIFPPRVGAGTGSPGRVIEPNLPELTGVFGQCSRAHGDSWGSVQLQELDSMILENPFPAQLIL